jgi:uncharacterized membrane protein
MFKINSFFLPTIIFSCAVLLGYSAQVFIFNKEPINFIISNFCFISILMLIKDISEHLYFNHLSNREKIESSSPVYENQDKQVLFVDKNF